MKKYNLFNISESRNAIFGFSALWIAFFHSNIDFSFLKNGTFGNLVYNALFAIKAMGYAGVEIFFFLSGMGLYFSFSKEENIKLFYKKRFLRILPEAFFITIIFSVLYQSDISSFIYSVTFINLFVDGTRSTWFVTLIIIMYLLYPFIYKTFKKYELGGLIALTAVAVTLNAVLYFACNSYYSKIEILTTRIPIFLLGAYLGKFIKEKKEINISVCIVIMLLGLILTPIVLLGDIDFIGVDRYVIGFLALGVMFAISLLAGKLKTLSKVFVFFGMYSFEIYLLFESLSKYLFSYFPQIDRGNFVYSVIVFTVTVLISMALKAGTDYLTKTACKNQQLAG